jgi:hypothetical protein
MAKEPAYLRKLKEFSRGPSSIGDLFALENELSYGTSDRAVAVLMGAIVEDALRRFILYHLREDLNSDDRTRLFGPEGALGTFSSKTVLAYALKLIGKTTRDDLDLIRNLRNEFAHSRRPLHFEFTEVEVVCSHLTFPDLPGTYTPKSYLESAPDNAALAKAIDPKHPRTRYYKACHNIAYRMRRLSAEGAPSDVTVLPPDPLP